MRKHLPFYTLVSNLGEVDPIGTGEDGVYLVKDTEVALRFTLFIYRCIDPADPNSKWMRYGVDPDTCLGWEEVLGFAGHCSDDNNQFLEWVTSGDQTLRAKAVLEMVNYYGASNYDHYPVELTESEVKAQIDELGIERHTYNVVIILPDYVAGQYGECELAVVEDCESTEKAANRAKEQAAQKYSVQVDPHPDIDDFVVVAIVKGGEFVQVEQ